MIDQLVPDEKREGVVRIRHESEGATALMSLSIGELAGTTVTLVLGFVVHAFLM